MSKIKYSTFWLLVLAFSMPAMLPAQLKTKNLPLTFSGIFKEASDQVYFHVFEEEGELKGILAGRGITNRDMAIPFVGKMEDNGEAVFTFSRTMDMGMEKELITISLDGKISKKNFYGEVLSKSPSEEEPKSQGEFSWGIDKKAPMSTEGFKDLAAQNMARLDSAEAEMRKMREELEQAYEGLEAEVEEDAEVVEQQDVPLPVTQVEFDGTSHDFGEIKQGAVVSHTFYFQNTGNVDLKIENVKPSCGCTTPDWTREAIPPGEKGFIKVEFDSKGKSGIQRKTVTVVANTEPKSTILTFSGEVVTE